MIKKGTLVKFNIGQGHCTGMARVAERSEGFYRLTKIAVTSGDVMKHMDEEGKLWVNDFELQQQLEDR